MSHFPVAIDEISSKQDFSRVLAFCQKKILGGDNRSLFLKQWAIVSIVLSIVLFKF